MRFKQQQNSGIPEVNLIPMLNVMMGILAFFALITMTLAAQQSVEVPLPSKDPAPASSTEPPEPLMVAMDVQGQVFVNDEPMAADAAFERRVLLYLDQTPDGVVIFQPSSQLPYSDVLAMLEVMRAIGGDRISLAIDDVQ
jgi:biopolymer transport protein ExbD